MGKLTIDVFEKDGAWDERHASPILEILERASDGEHALRLLRTELEDNADEWIATNREAIEEVGCGPGTAHEAYVNGYIAASRSRLRREGKFPRAGTGLMSPEEWIAIRQRRSKEQWNDEGDLGFEREVMVRDALKRGASDPWLAEQFEADPSIVRSGSDTNVEDVMWRYFNSASQRHLRHHIVLLFTEYAGIGDPSSGSATFQDLNRANEILNEEWGLGGRWTWEPVTQGLVAFTYSPPIEPKENPRSVMAGSSWKTASDKLRSAAATQPKKKNPPFREVARKKWGNAWIVIERGDYGMLAWLESANGVRHPISFGGDVDDMPNDPEHAMKLAERFLRRVEERSRWSMEHDARDRDDDDDPEVNPASKDLEDAKAKFEEFHRKKPTKIGEFAKGFSIPTRVVKLGKAVHVLYRSNKKDPVSGKQPKKPVNYIHDHDAGVCVYVPEEIAWDQHPDVAFDRVRVPDFACKADALTFLGQCLGFAYKDDEGQHDAEGDAPLPELYATPCGKALLVVQDKREVLAMIWGGALGVYARGIDG